MALFLLMIGDLCAKSFPETLRVVARRQDRRKRVSGVTAVPLATWDCCGAECGGLGGA